MIRQPPHNTTTSTSSLLPLPPIIEPEEEGSLSKHAKSTFRMMAALLFFIAIAILLLLIIIAVYITICRHNFNNLCKTPITNPITNQTKLSQQIVIIGGGLSGIAAAKTFLQYGYTNITILEASHEIGGVWRSTQYVGASIQIPYWLYQYADFPWPKDLIEQAKYNNVSPDKAIVQKYIQRYAERYDLFDKVDIRYGCYVKKMTRDATRGVWKVLYIDNEGNETMEADVLLMCIGNNSSNPIIPNIPGRELYEGTVLHSSEVGDGSILNENNAAANASTRRNICIVGGSKSATTLDNFILIKPQSSCVRHTIGHHDGSYVYPSLID